MLRKIIGLFLVLPFYAPLITSANTAEIRSEGLCFNLAGQMYQIDPLLLEAIGFQESKLDPFAINNANTDGTSDRGVMGVNSSHIPELKALGIIRNAEDLYRPCLNIQIGTWILAKHFKYCGVNWNCLGSYNAGFKKNRDGAREKYADIIYRRYRNLSQERRNTVLR